MGDAPGQEAQPLELLRVAEGLLGLLALRDVGHHPVEPPGAIVLAADDHAVPDPPDRAVGGPDPVLRQLRLGLAREQSIHDPPDPVPVLLVDRGQPAVGPLQEVLRRPARDRFHDGRVVAVVQGPVGGDLRRPEVVGDRAQDPLQLLLRTAHLRRSLLDQALQPVPVPGQLQLRALALPGVADGADQQLPGHVVLHQEVLRSGLDGRDGRVPIRLPREHHDRHLRSIPENRLHRRQPRPVGQGQVEQHQVDGDPRVPETDSRLLQPAHHLQDELAARRSHQGLVDEARVPRIVLHQEDPGPGIHGDPLSLPLRSYSHRGALRSPRAPPSSGLSAGRSRGAGRSRSASRSGRA